MPVLSSRSSMRFVLLTLLSVIGCEAAQAQFGTFSRITSPNGRQVLEVRMGTMPANRNLVFTAVITAGPISGSTSLMLQQALARDIFNAGAPAAGWTVVRSSITAFSLGGGCGRSNLIDFPFINNNRPEILRITGTTQQVITLGIAGNNDQYDSIDCTVTAAGQVVYILTNRTRQTLELRREQGGLLQLVRDNFGAVRTPFQGGIRPSIRNVRPRVVAVAPDGTAPKTERTAKEGIDVSFETVRFLYDSFVSPIINTQGDILDAGLSGPFFSCFFGAKPNTTAFGNVNESAVGGSAAVADATSANRFDLNFYALNANGSCTPGPSIPMSSRAGGSLYTFAGIAAVSSDSGRGAPGTGVPSTTVIDTNTIATFENGTRTDRAHPMGGRGGPKAACAIRGGDTEGGVLIAGPGATTAQLQHSVLSIDYAAVIFNSDGEDLWQGNHVHCDQE
jgi:hypothetical protein